MKDKRTVDEIFNGALELPDPAKQAEYLDEACADDQKLRVEVEALLRSYKEAGDFLETPPVEADVTLVTSATEDPGTLIGRYKLLEKLGEGGMATVYMAQQEHPIRRRVALKLIKLGMDTKQVIARFEAERQALAMMDHPNIAKVLDAGATETGRPYFVMELVKGLHITKFCDENHLTVPERLDLFISVCQAVQHAHQRGIIHRDIKPSNVLVTLHDGAPVAKVIDFGIAKAVNQQLTEKTVFTRYSQMIGTPEYMSPEQAEMSGLDIDTRTDVFSLGVLLYELLTGTTPFDPEYLLSKGYGQMLQIIREEEPILPSTKIGTLGNVLTDIAKRRKTNPESLSKSIRTDLDWIVMKTLEKDRNHRYETAHALASDIQRHLHNQPISVGTPNTLYHIRKFIRRNRSKLVTALSILAVLLVLATSIVIVRIGAIRQYHARSARDLVQRLLDAETTQVPGIIEEMAPYAKWTEPLLRRAEERAKVADDSHQRLHCALALLPFDPSEAQYLSQRLFEVGPEQLRILSDALRGRPELSADELWKIVENEKESPDRRLRAACILASHDPLDARWPEIAPLVVKALLIQDTPVVRKWSDMLRPQHAHLLPPMKALVRGISGPRDRRWNIAAEILMDFASDQPDVLCSLVMDAVPQEFRVLFPALAAHRDDVLDVLVRKLYAEVPDELTEEERDELSKQKVNAAIALLRLETSENVWPLLRFAADPRIRTLLIHRFSVLQVAPMTIIDRLRHETDLGVRAALVLALGEYPLESIAQQDDVELIQPFLQLYRDDPQPSIHSAVECALRRWGQSQALDGIDNQLIGADTGANRRWYVNSQGQTMAMIPGPTEFLMGPGPSVARRKSWPDPVTMRINRGFSIATKEVTQEQFNRFLQDHPDIELSPANVVENRPDVPVRCTWYQAACYCRWLSEQEGVPEDQMCFPPVSQIAEGMQPYADYLDRTGYRLPSEAEWEYACRAGTVTRYCCGYGRGTLTHYSWHQENANGALHPVGILKPNDFGLFDVHGNVWEYCYESAESRQRSRSEEGGVCLDMEDTSSLTNRIDRVSCGGSFCDGAIKARVFVRINSAPHMGSSGIRLVRTVPMDTVQLSNDLTRNNSRSTPQTNP